MLSVRRLRSDGGATLVEAAIVLPVLFLVLLAVVEFGMLFSTTSTTTSSTRDGARYATAHYAVRSDKVAVGAEIRDVVVGDLKALTGMATPVRMWVYKAGADGLPATNPTTCATNCLRYSWNSATGTFDYDVGSSPWTAIDACVTVASPRLDDLGVMVEVDHETFTGVIGSGVKTIKERTVLRLEPLPTTQCPT